MSRDGNGGKHKGKSQRHQLRMGKAERERLDNPVLEASQSSLRSWADEMNDLAEHSSTHSSPVADQTFERAVQFMERMGVGEGQNDISSIRRGFVALCPLKQEPNQDESAVTMPAGVQPVLQNPEGEGFMFVRQICDVDAAVAASRGYGSDSLTTATMAPLSYVEQPQVQSLPSTSHMVDTTEVHCRLYSSFEFDSRPLTSRPQSDSTQRYLSSSGLCRPTKYQQQQNSDAQLTLANSLKCQSTISRQYHMATVLEQDDSLQPPPDSIDAPILELSPPSPTLFIQHPQQRRESKSIIDTAIDSPISPHSFSAPRPSLSYNLYQSQEGRPVRTQSHFVGTPAHSQDPIADLGVPIVGQSPAEAQLEVTSRVTVADPFIFSRNKTSSPAPLDPIPSAQLLASNCSDENLQPHLEGTLEHQLDSTMDSQSRDVPGGRYITESRDDRPVSPPSLRSPTSSLSAISMDSSLWHHVVEVHPPSLDLSDSSSQLAKFERYIKTFIDPQVTKYIMVNTPIYLPSFSSVSKIPTMSKEVLRPLTPPSCQEYTYFLLRLESIIKNLQGLSVEHLYWKIKRRRLLKDVRASHEWLRKKMEERIHGEEKALQKEQKGTEDRILRSLEAEENQGRQRRGSEDSNKTSSSLDSGVLQAVEAGINEVFVADGEEERATFHRWDDDQRAEHKRSAAMEQPQTPIERVSKQRENVEKSLRRYIAAGGSAVETMTPPKTRVCASPPPTPAHPALKLETTTDCLTRVGWVGRETDSIRRRKVRFADEIDEPSPETPAPGSTSLLSSGSKRSFTGSPYERTWTTTPAASRTDAQMDKDLQADADEFIAARLPPSPSPEPRNNDARSSSQRSGMAAHEDANLRESTHPDIAKTPPKSPGARMQQFYATLTARGIRFGAVSRGLETPTNKNSRQRTLVAVPSRDSLNGARARSLMMGGMGGASTAGESMGTREEGNAETPPALTFGPPRKLRLRNYLARQTEVSHESKMMKEVEKTEEK